MLRVFRHLFSYQYLYKLGVIFFCALFSPNALISHYEFQSAKKGIQSDWVIDKKLLTLEEYLNQVMEENTGYKAASNLSYAFDKEASTGKLLSSPMFKAKAYKLDDKLPRVIPKLFGDENIFADFTFEIGQETRYGSEWIIGSEIHHERWYKVDLDFVPQPDFYLITHKLYLKQSLIKNYLLNEIRSENNKIRAKSMEKSYLQQENILKVLSEAKSTYWKLAIAKQILDIYVEHTQTTEALLKWCQKRYEQNLLPSSEVFRAESLYNLQKMQLQTQEDKVKGIAWKFNTLRGSESETLNQEKLEIIDSYYINHLSIPKRAPMPAKLLAFKEKIAKQEAKANINRNHILPQLDLYTRLELGGLNKSSSTAYNQSWSGNKNQWEIGIIFQIPLNICQEAKSLRALKREIRGLQQGLEWKKFETDQNWENLVHEFYETKKAIALHQTVQDTQKLAVENEKQRYKKGLSTMFTINSFEDNYYKSKIATLKTYENLLQILSKMKMYEDVR